MVNSIRDVLADSAGVDLVKSTVSKTLATGFEKLTLLGAAAINGTGNAAANVMTGQRWQQQALRPRRQRLTQRRCP